MKLRSVSEVLPKTRVVLRMDLDVPMQDGVITDVSRLTKSIPTIKLLLEKECKIAIIGKLGRPEGHDPKLSMRPVYLELMSMLEPGGENLIESIFVEDVNDRERLDLSLVKNHIIFLENLRFWKGEESNDPDFLKNLVEMSQAYVDDAITVAHRRHRSVMLYKQLPGFYGLAFIEEIEKITKVLDDPKRPLTIILGGAKEDKLDGIEKLLEIADNVLIGGKLPLLLKEKIENNKLIVAKLREDTLDLSDEDIENFKKIIEESKMIIWAGAMGYFEKEDCKKGTLEIAKAVANSDSYKIIAGGDTGASIINLGLSDKIDLIASGGGMMLELITKGKLPAWE